MGGLLYVLRQNDLPQERDRILAERKTPIPAKITLAGENTYKIRFQRLISSRGETYQTDSSRDGGRKRIEDVNSRAQPLGQSLIALTALLKFSNSILKESNNGSSRLARLQLGGERVCEEVFLRLLLV